jgi:hypothetical protein
MEHFRDMPERVASAFEAYIALGPKRSLRSLAAMKEFETIGKAIATLKRWSVRYHWQARLTAHEREVVKQMEQQFKDALLDKRQIDLNAIEAVKERFYMRVTIDPNDPNLTAAQRRRALNPTLLDFCRIIQIEQVLFGRLVQARAKPEAAGERYTDEELQAMMRALAQVRHGLPPRPNVPTGTPLSNRSRGKV